MNDSEYKNRKCLPCENIGEALTKEKALDKLQNLPHWILSNDGKSITRNYVVKNFMTAIKYIADIAVIAENDNHHPDIHLTGYRNLKITLTTHALSGLTENDLIVATKINTIAVELKNNV